MIRAGVACGWALALCQCVCCVSASQTTTANPGAWR